MVVRGTGGALPGLDVGTGEGVPLTGSYKRTGKDEEHHSGPKCGRANPPQIQPANGCGVETAKGSWSLAWKKRGTVYPVLMFDELRENCPSGPPHGLEWEKDVVPSIAEVAHAGAGVEVRRHQAVHGPRVADVPRAGSRR